MRCEACGKEFDKYIWDEGHKCRNTCSIDCADTYICARRLTKENETVYEFRKRISREIYGE